MYAAYKEEWNYIKQILTGLKKEYYSNTIEVEDSYMPHSSKTDQAERNS